MIQFSNKMTSCQELRAERPGNNIHMMTVSPFIVDTGMIKGAYIRFPSKYINMYTYIIESNRTFTILLNKIAHLLQNLKIYNLHRGLVRVFRGRVQNVLLGSQIPKFSSDFQSLVLKKLLRTGALHPLPNLSGCKCTRCTRTNEAPAYLVRTRTAW